MFQVLLAEIVRLAYDNKGGNVKRERGMVGCGGNQMYTTVAQNKYCESVKRLLFVEILNISVVLNFPPCLDYD